MKKTSNKTLRRKISRKCRSISMLEGACHSSYLKQQMDTYHKAMLAKVRITNELHALLRLALPDAPKKGRTR